MGSQYGKVLKTVNFDTDQGVTVFFEDGTTASGSNLIGADGAKSPTRTILLGHEKSATQPTPYLMTNLATKYTAEQAMFVRRLHSIMAYSIHPDGIFSWQSSKCCIFQENAIRSRNTPQFWRTQIQKSPTHGHSRF
jgi:2-polyprenyl-6-methoxyphenol hydroxylase-like FAD-dependent oxidoreductase